MAAAGAMLRAAQCYSPSLSSVGLLRLKVDAHDPFALPTVVVIATGIGLIWTNMMKSAVTSLAAMRAELEASAGLLRQARGSILQYRGYSSTPPPAGPPPWEAGRYEVQF